MARQIYVWHRGHRMTKDFADAWEAAEQRAGFKFGMTQGGFNSGGVLASAGTHDGDAGDWSVYEPGGRLMSRAKVGKMIESLRWAGIAASLRTNGSLYGVPAQGFTSPHVHGVPNFWGKPSAGAVKQAYSYREGRNGLRSNTADVGPGHTRNYVGQRHPRRPIIQPVMKEDTLSEKEVAEIKAHIDAKHEAVMKQLTYMGHNIYSGAAENKWRELVRYETRATIAEQAVASASEIKKILRNEDRK